MLSCSNSSTLLLLLLLLSWPVEPSLAWQACGAFSFQEAAATRSDRLC
jgi:hypothetical protein